MPDQEAKDEDLDEILERGMVPPSAKTGSSTSWFSFGYDHRHEIDGRVFDRNVIAKIMAPDPRLVMNAVFGQKWAFEYTSPPDHPLMRDLPVIEVSLEMVASDDAEEANDRCLDDEVYVLVDDLSWRHGDREVASQGIYKITYRELFDVYSEITGKDEEDFWETLEGVGLDNRWFRLSSELYEASARWIEQGKRVTTDFVLAF